VLSLTPSIPIRKRLIGLVWLRRLAHRREPPLVYVFHDAISLAYSALATDTSLTSTCPARSKPSVEWPAAIPQERDARRVHPTLQSLGDCRTIGACPFGAYRPRPHRPAGAVPVIAWTGSHGSAQHLRFVRARSGCSPSGGASACLSLGSRTTVLTGGLRCRRWRPETELQDLWSLDLGSIRLLDDGWAKGRCAMKANQYLGVGVPAVASPVGASRDVEDGVSGFGAASEGP
jgi:hypothetical protein